MVRRVRTLLVAVLLLAAFITAPPGLRPAGAATHTVTFDKYSLIVDGRRLVLWSGEFHYWRLPSPDLWRDVLQKMKAAGFNATSIYFDWGFHSPAPGVYDFSGIRDLDRLLDIAAEVGIYVIARPGPYINAETDTGGFPAWLVTQSGKARTSAPDYLAAARDWLHRVDLFIGRHQYTTGTGTVLLYQIENELYDSTRAGYMQALIDQVRADGITVPTTGNHNQTFLSGTGAPDIPGWDRYPQGFNCSDPTTWHGLKSFPRLSASKPQAIFEFGSGSFDPWGGAGYDNCRTLTNGPYQSVFFKNILSQGVTITNFYMTYGGSSWGWLADPAKVYSSYDYGAPIDESRQLTAKYDTLKRLGYFVNAVAPLAKTDAGSLGSAPSNTVIHADVRINPDTRTQLIVLRHNDVTATTDDTTTIGLSTVDGSYTRVPQQGSIRLRGRDSKMYLAHYSMGAAKLVYSTSELMTHATIGGRDIAVLYGRNGQGGETVLRYASRPTVAVQSGTAASTWDAARGDLRLNYTHTNGAPVHVLVTGGGAARPLQLLLTSDGDASAFWRYDTASGPVLVRGSYLLRSASVTSATAALTGDTRVAGPVEVWGTGVTSVTWNGQAVTTTTTATGSRAGTLPGPAAVSLPALSWRTQTDTAEAGPGFADAGWRPATNGLAADPYGFHHGNVWYRGHFTPATAATSVTVSALTGVSGSYAAWLNGTYLGSGKGGASSTLTVPSGLTKTGRDNVLAILVDNAGHNEDFRADDTHKQPRGLASVSLAGTSATVDWRIQGSLGADRPVDPARGPMNTGGLGGERRGWFLPGFPDSAWAATTLPRSAGTPGVAWYRSTVRLDLPAGQDTPLALTITDSATRHYSALLFVNGWQIGRYVNDIGPQHLFPIPSGIVNPGGTNTVAIAVWSKDAASAGLGTVSLTALNTYASSLTAATVPAPGYDPAVYEP
jgi:beta-galactosidase GanA